MLEPMLSVHAALCPDGRVLVIDFLGSYQNSNRPDAALLQPTDGTLKLVWESGPDDDGEPGPPSYPGLPPGNGSHHRLYCSGHTWTAGLLVLRGGEGGGPGNEKTTIYDPGMGPVGGFKAGPIERWCLEPPCPPGMLADTKR